MATIKMATKEQERKALEQIKQIIAGLGNCSYIGMAMEGMIEDAEENIENDFALSMKGRLEDQQKITKMREEQLDAMAKDLIKTRKELELAKKTLADESERREKLSNLLKESEKVAWDRMNELTGLRNKNQEMEDQIIRLKAKCFDLMEKGC